MNSKNMRENDLYKFDDEEMTVTLNLEDGPVECSIVVILEVGEMDYIVLLPLDEDGENEEGVVWFYRYFEDEADVNAEPVLEYIDSDPEFEKVSEAFEKFLKDAEFDELIDDDDL